MQQAEAVDSEENSVFGKDNNGYNLPNELQRGEERLNKIRGLTLIRGSSFKRLTSRVIFLCLNSLTDLWCHCREI